MDRATHHPRDLPPLWLLAALLTVGGLHWFAPLAVVALGPWRTIGMVAAGGGLLLLLASIVGLRRARTGIRPFSPATALVERGPFRRSRNPIYLGMVAMVLGAAIASGSLSPLFVPPLFWWVLDQRFVRREERFLRECFGDRYDEYCRRVRRWL
jgi:protein-S-isoprenylcysteine O-methyltransferase Ste14